MSFLPIVDRELRVTARRPRTYWSRLLVALIAIVIGAVLLGAYALTPQTQVGQTLFWALAGLSFCHCLFAGRMATADSISEEKREGTLGLLFLTDLKGYDIVLGKVVATSLNSFYGLLAIFPVLALTLLLGGMTNGEFARMALVLVNMFLLSLAIGIFASALSREARRAYGGNLLMTLALVALLPWLAAWLYTRWQGVALAPEYFMASPVFAFFVADQARYALTPELFWASTGIAHGWTWLLLIVASWAVPRNWQDEPSLPRGAKRNWREFWRRLSYGRADQQMPFRKRLLDVNGYYWLTARARLKPLHVWLLILGGALWWLGGWLLDEDGVWLDPATVVALAVILNSAIKLWVAVEAGQQISDDRRMGAMELLLSTPLTVKDILKGQILALRRQFLWPLLVIIVIEISFMVISLRDQYEAETLCLWLAGIFMLLADLVALVFTSMAAALVAKNQQQAILTTIGRILVLPWLAFWIIAVLANLWVSLGSDNHQGLGWQFHLGLWVGLGLIANAIFGFHSVRRLLTGFRQLATERFDASAGRQRRRWFSRSAPVVQASGDVSPALTGQLALPLARPRRRRRIAIALTTVMTLLVLGSIYVYRQLYPTPPGPILIKLGRNESLEGLRAFPGAGGFFLVMPDGALWHWGQGTPQNPFDPTIPRPLDKEHQWQTIGAASDGIYGLGTDGSLWSVKYGTNGSLAEPRQIGHDVDWKSIAIGAQHFAAIKNDGSLWMWGDNLVRQLGQEAPSLQSEPIQLGTNLNWKSVRHWQRGTLALQTNGSLWFWGEVTHVFKNNTRTNKIFAQPTLYCRDTNWATLAGSWFPSARDTSGKWHKLFHDLPNPEVPADANSRLFLTRATTDRLVFGLAVGPAAYQAVYEVRPDGSLMFSSYTTPNSTAGPVENWQRFGDRTDWKAVWSDGGTMLGLTADGTVWTWGIDLTASADTGLKRRLTRLEEVLGEMFGRPPRRGSNPGLPPLQIEPRPLIKFVREP